MSLPFAYHAGQLACDGRPLAELARAHGTPLYVYSAAALRENYRRLAAAFAPLDPLICFAVKSNANVSLLRRLRELGAGFDIVSGGELHCALAAGSEPDRIVFAGVGKTDAELAAGLEARVGWFNVESADELARLNALAAARGGRARVAFRLNPDVEPDTHHHIRTGGGRSKFGLPLAEARALAARWGDFPALDLRGVHIHIGSQVADAGATVRALQVTLDFIQAVPGLDTLDIGGGFPVPYRATDDYPPIEAFAAPIVELLRPWAGRLHFHLEPGRYLVCTAGALVTTVQAVKQMAGGRIVIVDTGMHHLLRPALYDAYHEIVAVAEPAPGALAPADVAGPICESSDFLGHDRQLPALRPGDQLAVLNAGAYGYSMASNYNAQPRPAEVLVEAGEVRLIRQRETWADLTRLDAPAV
ncbi:MAG: diaminopimelate decarboxylase [Anaerolineales bacterium]|nr:diaminopimelate decarboxylase [Anaerolineales bacterium]